MNELIVARWCEVETLLDPTFGDYSNGRALSMNEESDGNVEREIRMNETD